MKERFNKTTWRAVGAIAASFLLVVSFQNCGKAGFDSELDGTLDLGSDATLTAKYGTSTGEKVAAIPFAYDAGFDTVTYNSCAQAKLKQSDAYFSIKAGAYSTGGIKLKTDFFSYVDQNFSPIYPATSLSVEQYKELLQDSPANKEMTPNMAMRVKNSLTDVYTKGTLTLYQDIIPMVGLLSDPLISESLINKGVTSTYFPFSTEQKVLEAALTFNDSETMASSFRGYLTNTATLALTFTPPEPEIYKVAAVSTTYPVKTAYGKGYNLGFSSAPYTVAGSAVQRVMSSITEVDLASPSTSGKAWTCNRKYFVVPEADASLKCPAHTQAEIDGSATIRTELAIARRHLRADQWDVNVTYGCVVPKVTSVSCYEANTTSFPTVEYDLTKTCYPATSNANSQCLHWISICTRDNI
jgi:hypothetical protein